MRNSRADPRIPAFARKGKSLFVPVLFGPPLFFSMGLFPDPMKKNIGKRAKKLTGCFGTVGSAIFLSNPARHGIETGAAARGNPYFAALVTKPETGFVPMFAAAAFFCASRKFFIASPGNPAAANAGKSGPSPPVCVNSCPGPRNTGFRKWKLCARIFHKFLDFIKIRFPVKAVLRKKPLRRPFRTASRTSAKTFFRLRCPHPRGGIRLGFEKNLRLQFHPVAHLF
ncbi:MAG: hypothetical protein C6W57_14590 [Caldibacillus debilis]|nr:MAG: hypothetical protein C6W57_14590 [Caldibacillus debilis]